MPPNIGCSFQRNEKIGLRACGSEYRLRQQIPWHIGIHLSITQVFLYQSPWNTELFRDWAEILKKKNQKENPHQLKRQWQTPVRPQWHSEGLLVSKKLKKSGYLPAAVNTGYANRYRDTSVNTYLFLKYLLTKPKETPSFSAIWQKFSKKKNPKENPHQLKRQWQTPVRPQRHSEGLLVSEKRKNRATCLRQ